MADLTTLEQLQKIVDQNLREIKLGKIEQYLPSMIPMLYNVIKSDRPYEEFWEIETLPDLSSWTGAVTYSKVSPGYYRRIEPAIFDLGVSFEKKLADDDKFGIVEKRTMLLKQSDDRTREKKAVRPFTLANSIGYDFEYSEEGVGLCSYSHKTKVPGVSTASGFSNIGSTALSKTAIDAARLAMALFRTPTGELANAQGDTIICPQSLFSTACEATGYDPRSGADSAMDPDSANRKINVARGIRVIPWNFLDMLGTTTMWFMVDFRMMKEFLIWINRIGPEYESHIDFETKSVKASVYDRFGYGTNAWQWIFMGNQ